MYRFRLKSSTLGVDYSDGLKGHAVMIPAGSEIVSYDPAESPAEFHRSSVIGVEWNGNTVSVFRLDLLERGERVEHVVG
jgi:hypothetical protein